MMKYIQDKISLVKFLKYISGNQNKMIKYHYNEKKCLLKRNLFSYKNLSELQKHVLTSIRQYC